MWNTIQTVCLIVIGCVVLLCILRLLYRIIGYKLNRRMLIHSANDDTYMKGLKERDPEIYAKLLTYRTKDPSTLK